MKNILLLTDFSENAQNAIEYALNIFANEAHNFYLLNVHKTSKYTMSSLMSSGPGTTVYDSLIKDPKVKLAAMIKELDAQTEGQDFHFESICDYDTFVSAVNQVVNLKKIDLIVMGTNGTTGAAEVVFGSNTINVIRNVKAPVLAIPQGFVFKTPRTILFATESNESFIENSLKPLLNILLKFDAELQILTIENDEPTDQEKEKRLAMDEFFSKVNHSFYSLENIPSDIAIDSFVQVKAVDLTAKIINKESFLKRLISGSSTDEITYNSRVPLLIMHP